MAENTITKARKILCELLDKKNISADKIIFFGSQTKGTAGRESDVDILVVSKKFRRKGIFEKARLTSGIQWELVNRLNLPVDLLYYSDQEWEKGESLIVCQVKNGLVFDMH
jgi:predicted nucleotidyltransferase